MIGLGLSLLRGLTGIGSGGSSPSSGGAISLDQATFEDLLDRARSGELTAGFDVSVARGVDAEVSEETLTKLGPIVESALQSGASRIAVVEGDRVLEVDVLLRRVTGVRPVGEGELVTGVDAVVRLDEPKADELVGPPFAARPAWADSEEEGA